MARNRSKRPLLFLLPALTLASPFALPTNAQSSEADQLTKTVAELYTTGKYELALPLARQVLEIQEKALGPDHPDVATALNNLASIYRSTGQYALAESLYRRALLIDERALGPGHAQVARDLNNLASLYDSQDRYADAEPLHKWALATDEKALGPKHPDVASDLSNLAFAYEHLGRYADAESNYKRALVIQTEAQGANHRDVAETYNNLGSLYASEGRVADAESSYEMALAIEGAGRSDWLRNKLDTFPEVAEVSPRVLPSPIATSWPALLFSTRMSLMLRLHLGSRRPRPGRRRRTSSWPARRPVSLPPSGRFRARQALRGRLKRLKTSCLGRPQRVRTRRISQNQCWGPFIGRKRIRSSLATLINFSA